MKIILKHIIYFLISASIFFGVFYIADIEETKNLMLVGGLLVLLYCVGYVRGMLEAK